MYNKGPDGGPQFDPHRTPCAPPILWAKPPLLDARCEQIYSAPFNFFKYQTRPPVD